MELQETTEKRNNAPGMPERNYAVDILRILSMVYVVVLHIDLYGVDSSGLAVNSFPYWVVNVTRTLSMVAVNCFVLISGYYMSTSRIKPKKLLKLWIQVETYSVGIYLLSCTLGLNTGFDWKTLIWYACPCLASQYWFFTMYFLLMLVSPVLNIVIGNLTQEQYKKCLLVQFLVFSVLPTINIFGDQFGTRNGFSLIWFMNLYLIAGYMRKYTIRRLRYGTTYFAACLVILVIKVVCNLLSPYISLCSIIINLIYMYNSVFMLAASVSLFAYFINCRHDIGELGQRMIEKVSALSFGIYLFHEHSAIQDWLWNTFIHLSDYIHEPTGFVLRMSYALCVIVLIGLAIELIRQTVDKCAVKMINLGLRRR